MAKGKKIDETETLAQALAERLRPFADLSFLEEFTTNDFSEYIDNPIGFFQEVLNLTPWNKQKEIALSVLKNRNTVVESGHSIGKTVIASAIALWWASTRPAVVVSSAPTATGVNSLLWRQMRAFKNKAAKPIPGRIYDTPRWEFSSKECYGIGISPRKGSAEDITGFQGHHHPNLLVILDEGAGLNKLIFEAALSLATGEGNKVFVIGNPISRIGPFYAATQSPSWHHIRVSCLEHPNIKERRDVIPGAVSFQWVKERVLDWCRPGSPENGFFFDGEWWIPSPVFMARVLGQPADEADDQLIAYSWIDGAVARWQDTEGSGTYGGDSVVGLDVARQGADSSVIVHRIGDHVKKVIQRHGNDITETVGWLINYIKENNIDYAYVDDIGVGCFDEKTEILTEDGWKHFYQLTPDLKVLSMNPETRQSYYTLPTKHISKKYNGKMYLCESATLNFCITPNHKLFYRGVQASKWKLDEIQNIKINEIKMQRSFMWQGQEQQSFILQGVNRKMIGLAKGYNNCWGQEGKWELKDWHGQDITILMDTWLAFLGWYLSEGCCYKGQGNYFISITQKGATGIKQIREILITLGFKFQEKYSKTGCCNFVIASKALYDEVYQYGRYARNKTVPSYVKTLSPRQIRVFLDTYLAGDGQLHKGMKIYSTSSKQMANDLQELVLKCGNYASISTHRDFSTVWIENHWAKRGGDFFRVNEWQFATDIHFLMNERKLRQVNYKGWIFCVTVEPDHLIFVRREGTCFWTGNSGVTDLCRSQGYSVTGVHVQKNAKDRNKFHDLHDEIWWTVREKLRTGEMSLPDDPLLIADLAAMRTTGHDMQGRPTFEKKDEMKKRLGRSPDSGDALALSYTGHYLDTPTEAKDYSEVLKEESRWPRSEVGQSRWIIGRRKTESRWRL